MPQAHVSLTLGGREGPERPRVANESPGVWVELSLEDFGVKLITGHPQHIQLPSPKGAQIKLW